MGCRDRMREADCGADSHLDIRNPVPADRGRSGGSFWTACVTRRPFGRRAGKPRSDEGRRRDPRRSILDNVDQSASFCHAMRVNAKRSGSDIRPARRTDGLALR